MSKKPIPEICEATYKALNRFASGGAHRGKKAAPVVPQIGSQANPKRGPHLTTGCKLFGNLAHVDGDSVNFVAEDGRTMFRVRQGSDGRSIEVSGVQSFQTDAVLYDNHLVVSPVADNVIQVSTKAYD